MSSARPRSRLRGWLGWVLALLFLGVAVYLAIPTQWGGPAAIARVSGTSMLPTYEPGDLLLTHRSGEYEVDDIVVYEVQDGGLTGQIAHRLIERHPDGTFTAKGDNNAEADPWPVTADEIQGKVLWRVPGAAIGIGALQSPVAIAALGAIATAALLWPRNRRPEPTGDSADGVPAPDATVAPGTAPGWTSPIEATPADPTPNRQRETALLLMAVIAGLVVASTGTAIVHFRRIADLEQAQQIRGLRDADQISTQFTSLTASIDSAAAWFAVAPDLDQGEFRVFAKELIDSSPDLSSIWWAPEITDEQRARFERRLRAKGQGPTLTRIVGSQLQQAERRPTYLPVQFHAAGDSAIPGFDVLSRPSSAAAVAWARDTGKVAVSGRNRRLTGDSVISAYEPVYRAGPVKTQHQRRERFRGIIGASLKYEPFLAGLLDRDESLVDSVLVDTDPSAMEPIVFSTTEAVGDAGTLTSPGSSWPWRQSIELPNREWVLVQRPVTPAMSWSDPEIVSWLMGLGVVTLLVGLTLMYNRSSRRTALIDELRAANAKLDYLASYDPVTRLPNRALAWREIQTRISAGEPFVVAFCHVPALAEINRQEGRSAGDRFLREVGAELREVDGVSFAHLGAAEFVGVFPDASVDAVHRRVVTRAGALARAAGSARTAPTVGVAGFPSDGSTPEHLLAAAIEDSRSRLQRTR